ncbi:hypothetical protein SALBM311S_07642 [Streptomyces alboniger]
MTVRWVQRWRRTWDEGGPRALRSQGPASFPRLSDKQFAQLEAELAKGPAAHRWEDQQWMLTRVTTVIGRRFHLTYTIQGVRKLLLRNGWSCQVPTRRAVERDDDAVAGWVKGVALRGRREPGSWSLARLRGRSRILHDAAQAKAWSQRGHTPVVRVRGRSRRRISIAALTCYKPGADGSPTSPSGPAEHLDQRIRRGLRLIPYRSHLMDGCLAETGLTIGPA